MAWNPMISPVGGTRFAIRPGIRIPARLLAALALGGALSSQAETGGVPDKIRSIFAQLEAQSITWTEAESELAALPSNQAVEVLIEELAHNPLLLDTDEGSRSQAYRALRDYKALQMDIGYEQFVACLGEPKYSRFCAITLLKEAPEQKQSNVVVQIGRFLGNPKIPDSDKSAIVSHLGRKGQSEAPYLMHMEAVFANREAGEHLRWMAANAMLRIGGLGRALPHFQEIDPVGQKGVMTALARFIGESDERCDYKPSAEYREARDGARKLVLKTMTSSDVEARKAALQSYMYVYGMDVLIIHSPEDYEWNPEPRSALERMANEDPDPELRANATEMLELDLDHAAAKIRRSLARIERRRQREGATETTPDQKDEKQD